MGVAGPWRSTLRWAAASLLCAACGLCQAITPAPHALRSPSHLLTEHLAPRIARLPPAATGVHHGHPRRLDRLRLRRLPPRAVRARLPPHAAHPLRNHRAQVRTSARWQQEDWTVPPGGWRLLCPSPASAVCFCRGEACLARGLSTPHRKKAAQPYTHAQSAACRRLSLLSVLPPPCCFQGRRRGCQSQLHHRQDHKGLLHDSDRHPLARTRIAHTAQR